MRFSLSCVSETVEEKHKASGNRKSIYPGNESIFITKNQKVSHNKRFAENRKEENVRLQLSQVKNKLQLQRDNATYFLQDKKVLPTRS